MARNSPTVRALSVWLVATTRDISPFSLYGTFRNVRSVSNTGRTFLFLMPPFVVSSKLNFVARSMEVSRSARDDYRISPKVLPANYVNKTNSLRSRRVAWRSRAPRGTTTASRPKYCQLITLTIRILYVLAA
jgi:hypothetical protein